MRKEIIITCQFSAIHCWPNCPIAEVAYLRNPHRHLFTVEMHLPVTHNDRDIEFITLKNQVQKDIQAHWEGKDIGSRSCEDIAEEFLHTYAAVRCEVREDGENGAIVYS